MKESNVAISRYANDADMQKPEVEIFNSLQNELKEARLLDIGIGGGRTTLYLKDKVKDYVGIDYSSKMIETTKNRIPEISNKVFVCNVIDMSTFSDNQFDIVFFSFNGLDYLQTIEERILALNEIYRVLKKGGKFIFSSHNLQDNSLFNFSLKKQSLIKTIEHIVKIFYRIVSNNKKTIMNSNYSYIKDGGHFFKLRNFYIKPLFQIEQLKDNGFLETKIFSLTSGKEVVSNFDKIKDPWLYYLTVKV
ncbi:MAG TPA: class I SAM-dependent methyltransferase [Spirochaetota bacterium]|nr:class I SAM-dependent methyltransferase [Spirochaetota bacterium]HOS32345.1 class I SAM-dependent methyltransferase [Spirochaetota bacterium]HOS54442.1 class I SAM-dependent methyltransferase [Spirochaetota bacterium]HQF76935.1 class I SAM-dependent methyltransferase [Spirochaetota bacterium]HQH30996.1 class I SAM-dependent methyltransferase [Spirochaetota bacterium]